MDAPKGLLCKYACLNWTYDFIECVLIPANIKATGPSGAAFCTYTNPPLGFLDPLSAWLKTVMSLKGGCLKYLYGLSITSTSLSIMSTLYLNLMDLYKGRNHKLHQVEYFVAICHLMVTFGCSSATALNYDNTIAQW